MTTLLLKVFPNIKAVPKNEINLLSAHPVEIQSMRNMDNTKLVDCIELPLKSRDDVLATVQKILSGVLEIYLNNFVAPFVGDRPMQSFIRQLVYSDSSCLPAVLKNVILLIGPLHISLNARECVLLIFQFLLICMQAKKAGQKTKTLESISVARGYLRRMDTCSRHDTLRLW